jgi:4-amino-4-deoxy-L-arabinose transferase-like glycosyltransferase
MPETTSTPRARELLILLVAGAALRLLLIAATAGVEPRIVDEQHYHRLAHSLYAGHGFAGESGPTSMRPPLYPWFVSALWTVTGSTSLLPVRAAQALLSLGTAVLVYFAAAKLFDARVALVAAGLATFYPSLLYSNLTILTEPLFTFLLAAAMLCITLAILDSRAAWAAAGGGLLGLAALTRSVVWPFPVVAAPALALLFPGNWRRRLVAASAMLLAHVLVLAPWAVRNTRLQGVFTVVDSMGGFNLWMSNSEATPPDRMWAAIDQGADQAFGSALRRQLGDQRLTEGQKDKWGQKEAMRYIRENPGTTLRRSLVKFSDFWGLDRELLAGISQGLYQPPRLLGLVSAFAVIVSYPPVLLLAILGVCLAPRNGWAPHLMLLLVVSFVCGIHTLVFGHSRYRLPLMPLLFVYAAAAWRFRSWTRLREGGAVAAAPALLGLLMIGIWLREVFVRDLARVQGLVERLLE